MTPKENLLRAMRRQKPEWVPSICKCANVTVAQSTVRDRAPGGNGYDWHGVYWLEHVANTQAPILEDVTEWKDIVKFPNLDEIDWVGGATKDCAGFDRENKATWAMIAVGPFERLHALMGFEEALIALMTEPDDTKELVDAVTDFRIQVLDRVITYYKPDVISMHDDYGTQNNLFMSPDTWRFFFKENIRKISDFVKSRGVVFDLHSCGKVDLLIEDFVDCGIDAWDSVQPCCDLDGIYKKYGSKLSFSPALGVHTLSGTIGTEEDARREVRWFIDHMGKYGGLVPRSDVPLVRQEMRIILEDEIERYGRNYYKDNPIPDI